MIALRALGHLVAGRIDARDTYEFICPPLRDFVETALRPGCGI